MIATIHTYRNIFDYNLIRIMTLKNLQKRESNLTYTFTSGKDGKSE